VNIGLQLFSVISTPHISVSWILMATSYFW